MMLGLGFGPKDNIFGLGLGLSLEAQVLGLGLATRGFGSTVVQYR